MTTATKKQKQQQQPTGMLAHEVPVMFDPNFKFPGGGRSITFDAASFKAWVEATMPLCKTMTTCDYREIKTGGVPVGDWVFYLKQIPMWVTEITAMFFTPRMSRVRGALELYRGKSIARVMFSAPVDIPVLCNAKAEPWMSLTPNEILTQRGQIRRSRGNVGVAGLGLGWATENILQRKQVTHCTVYEKSPDIIRVFGEPLLERFPGKLTIVNADAYAVDWMQYDVAIWDIWKQFGDANWDREFEKIRNAMRTAGKVCVGWGDVDHGH